MPTLRIVSVNDVYTLENLPRLKMLVRHHVETNPADRTIVTLAGDFLAPSLLSSIDAGRGMVDCLNDVGITHVTLGNHEDDIPFEELRKRLSELRAMCLGTNIRAGLDLPRHTIIEVADDLSIGLVGVVMIDEAVYRGKPFGGAEVIDANKAAMEEADLLIRSGCRSVIPLTHQSIADDRALATAQRNPPFPIIIGGHEHTAMLVDVLGTWIVKAGSEAANAIISNVEWTKSSGATAYPSPPTVTTRLEDVAKYPEDPALRARVDKHTSRIRELSTATLLHLKPGESLSSVGTRSRQTSIGTLICSKLRDALGSDACFFNGGGIRAARVYTSRLTYGDVEAEVPFDNEVVVVKLSGRTIRAAVAASRAKAPAESGSFLQVDDRVIVRDDGGGVVAINGAPMDLDRLYRVALVRELLMGLDHVEPLVQWAKENPKLVPPPGAGREPKMVLVQAFALAIWRELGGFDAVDANHDEQVTASEVADAVARVHPSQAPSPVLADLVMQAVDADADHIISRQDAASAATREANHDDD